MFEEELEGDIDPLEDLALRRKLKQQALANLQSGNNPYGDLGLQLAGGGIDTLSKYYNNRRPMEIMTGISSSPGYTTNAGAQVNEAIKARQLATRQKALDQTSLLKALESEATRRQNQKAMAEYRQSQMEASDFFKRAQLGNESAKAQAAREAGDAKLAFEREKFEQGKKEFEAKLAAQGKRAAGKGSGGSTNSVPGLTYVGGGSPSADDVKKVKAMHSAKLDLDAALDSLQEGVDKHGLKVMPGAGKVALENAYSDFVIKAKTAAELGALTGPDMGIINQMLRDPTGIYTNTTMNKKDYSQSIESAKQRAAGSLSSKLKAYGYAVPGSDKTQGGTTVRVISPNGKSGSIPKANLQKALSSGYRLAE